MAVSGSDTEKEAHKPTPETHTRPKSRRSPDPDAWEVPYKPNKISAGPFPISDMDDSGYRKPVPIESPANKTSKNVSMHFLILSNLFFFS